MDSSKTIHYENFKFSIGVIITSIIVILLFTYASVVIIDTKNTTVIIIALNALLSIIFGILCSMPLRLEINKTKIIISHPIGKTVILREHITESRIISKNDLKGSLRLFGSGGFMGWFGIFHNNKLGKYQLYSGDLENLHYIVTKEKNYIISSSVPIEL